MEGGGDGEGLTDFQQQDKMYLSHLNRLWEITVEVNRNDEEIWIIK